MTAGSQEAPAGYSLQDAAAILSVSVNTLRRRINAGQVRGERVQRAQGYVWRVYLDAEQPATDPPDQQAPRSLPQPPTAMMQAEAMATYTRALLGPLVDRLEALSRENERLTLEIEQLRASQRPQEGPTATEAPDLQSEAPRAWWKRVLAAVYG